MFYPVKVLNPKGKVVKIISRQKLSERHWKEMFDHPKNDRDYKAKRGKPSRLKAG